jgi:hypothetical protein
MAWVVGMWLVVGAGSSSCSQSEGETCQETGDCGAGLVCCRTPSAVRGACYASSDTRCGESAAPRETDAATDANMSTDDQSDGG